MSTSFEGISSRKQQKIDNLMRDSLWDIVRTPKAQRRLVITAAVSPVLLATTYGLGFPAIIIWVTCMAVSSILLNISVRKVTTLPDLYLDERQRNVRDRAFRSAYRGFATGLAIFWVFYTTVIELWKNGPLQQVDAWVQTTSAGYETANGHWHQNFWQWCLQWGWSGARLIEGSHLGNIVVIAIAVWAFWVTPLAVIAWNEAKRGGGVKRD